MSSISSDSLIVHRASSLRSGVDTAIVWRDATRDALLIAVSSIDCLRALPAALAVRLSTSDTPPDAFRLAMSDAVPEFNDKRRRAGVTAALICGGRISVANAGRGRAILCRYYSVDKITTTREKAFIRTVPLASDMRSLTLVSGDFSSESDARIALSAEVSRSAGDKNLAERCVLRSPDRVVIVVDLNHSSHAPPFHFPPESPSSVDTFSSRAPVPCPWCGAHSESCLHCRCVDIDCSHSERCSGTRYAARGRCYQCHQHSLLRKHSSSSSSSSDLKRSRFEPSDEDPT